MVGFRFANYTVLHTPVRSTRRTTHVRTRFFRTTLRAQSVPSKISTFLNKKMTPIVAYAQDLESFRALNNVMLMLVRSVPTYIHTALLHARLPSHTHHRLLGNFHMPEGAHVSVVWPGCRTTAACKFLPFSKQTYSKPTLKDKMYMCCYFTNKQKSRCGVLNLSPASI